MKIGRVGICISIAALLVACAGSVEPTETVTGECAGGRCTGVCVAQIENFAREHLGSEARDVYFAFANQDPSPLAPPAVAYFRTENCPNGEYQVQFFGDSRSCSQVYRGRVPNNVGKLLVVPEGCPS